MPIKPIERLLFMQGGLCFFCRKPVSTADASVEHLVASANGGSNRDDNCVACCKSLNALLGSMSLKEKMQVVLNQKGEFKCPNGAQKTTAKAKLAKPSLVAPVNDNFSQLLNNLKQRGNAKPRTVSKLKSMIGALFQSKISPQDVENLVQRLRSSGAITIIGSAITYK